MHTATMLRNGKVLIAGGFASESTNQLLASASAEIYDPTAGTFSSTGDLTAPRARHVAALLADGRVLIAGGWSPDSQKDHFAISAEIYDPSTGIFTATGSMISNGRVSSAVPLPDGRVFVSQDGDSAEIYDPAAGTFTLSGTYRGSATQVENATLLPNGLVLVVGCAPACIGGPVALLFDPKANTFSPTNPQRYWDEISTATWLADGTVLFVEGDQTTADAAEIYDPASRTFTYIGTTKGLHQFSTATPLKDGKVLIAGGQVPGGNGNNSVEIYVPETRTFVSAPDLAVGRHSHTATLLPDGSVLIAGGFVQWPSPTSSAEIYK